MTRSRRRQTTEGRAITWDQFKVAVRNVDLNSLIAEAAAVTVMFANGQAHEEWKALGITPWTIAEVARTALGWGGPGGQHTDRDTLFRLTHMSAQLIDEQLSTSGSRDGAQMPSDQLARLLALMFFEQFPNQQSVFEGITRSILLFGSAAEIPPGFTPQLMTPGWFERLTKGISFDDYVESIFLFSVLALSSKGAVSPDILDSPGYRALGDVIPNAARRVFTEHLLTSINSFKEANHQAQDPVPSAEKKFAFNPLSARPFVGGVAPVPVAPWVQAIITKAMPPAVYFLPPTELRKPFADDLGPIFQHYAGRQLELVDGQRQVLPEVRYRLGKNEMDSCDWFLELPDIVVLIECKARQPIESLRVGGTDWIRSIEDSIGHGIHQLNRSNAHITPIGALRPGLDISKPRVGLVVTLEPFYLNQNWLIRERLERAEIPVGVLSIGELERLVLLDAEELGRALLAAAGNSLDNVMLLNPALDLTTNRENSLLTHTWESIRLFSRVEAAAQRLRLDP